MDVRCAGRGAVVNGWAFLLSCVCVCVCVCVLATIDSVPGASDYRRNDAELQWLFLNNLVTTCPKSTCRLLMFASQPAK